MFFLKNLPRSTKAGLTLTGGILIQLTLGYYYTFGNLNPYLTSYLHEFISETIRYTNSIWINSTMAIAQSVSSALGGLIVVKFGFSLRATTLLGCVIMSSGIALTFITIKTSFFLSLITHGLMNGLGMGFAYVPPMSITMRWFPNHRGMAMAALLCGYGCGGIIFTQLQTLFINPDNLKPTDRDQVDTKAAYFSKISALDLLHRVPYSFLIMGGVIFTLQIIGLVLLFDPKEAVQDATEPPQSITVDLGDESGSYDYDPNEPTTSASAGNIKINTVKNELDSSNKNNNNKTDEDETNSLGVVYGRSDTGMSLTEVLKTPVFYMIWFMYAFTSIVPGVLSAYYKTFGEEFLDSDKFLTLVGSVSSVCNATGRIFWGFLIEKFSFKINMLLLNTSLIAFTATLIVTSYIKSEIVFMFWICAIYFTFCGIYVIMPIVTARCFGQKNFTLIYGLVFTTGIFANLGTASLASLKTQIGWFGLFLVLCGAAAISWIIAAFFNVKNSKKQDI